MRTLREDGLQKVLAGVTTLEEIYRTTVDDID
jgi:type II secretory ATPase GspE/PulE/Tfp pilus assembly ATPase PilB-like protein